MPSFVGHLAYTTTDQALRGLFEAYGYGDTVRIRADRATGRPRGLGFVEMPTDTEAQTALAGRNGTAGGGRPLAVSEARQREDRGGPRRPRWSGRPHDQPARGVTLAGDRHHDTGGEQPLSFLRSRADAPLGRDGARA